MFTLKNSHFYYKILLRVSTEFKVWKSIYRYKMICFIDFPSNLTVINRKTPTPLAYLLYASQNCNQNIIKLLIARRLVITSLGQTLTVLITHCTLYNIRCAYLRATTTLFTRPSRFIITSAGKAAPAVFTFEGRSLDRRIQITPYTYKSLSLATNLRVFSHSALI